VSTLLHATVYMFLHNLLNVLVQIANKMGLQKKICNIYFLRLINILKYEIFFQNRKLEEIFWFNFYREAGKDCFHHILVPCAPSGISLLSNVIQNLIKYPSFKVKSIHRLNYWGSSA
jgi:hypothetical protein